MNNVLPFDEINQLETIIRLSFADGKKPELEDIIDWMFDLYLLSYANGVETTNETLGSDWKPTLDDATKVVDAEVAGKTWRERTKEYYENNGSAEDFIRIVETEAHRDANTGAYVAAREAGATTKTWHCMMLPTSRDTHIYLDGVSAPIDGEFYSFKGGKTQYPGQWGIAEEDVNCLCWLSFSK